MYYIIKIIRCWLSLRHYKYGIYLKITIHDSNERRYTFLNKNIQSDANTVIGISIGLVLGTTFGLLINNLTLGMMIGITIGFGVSKIKQKK